MNYDGIFLKTQEQYKKMYQFMQSMDVSLGVIKINISTQTANYKVMNKRLLRVEEILKIKEGD